MKKIVVILCLVTFFCTGIPAFAADQVQIKVLDYPVIGYRHEGLEKYGDIAPFSGNYAVVQNESSPDGKQIIIESLTDYSDVE